MRSNASSRSFTRLVRDIFLELDKEMGLDWSTVPANPAADIHGGVQVRGIIYVCITVHHYDDDSLPDSDHRWLLDVHEWVGGQESVLSPARSRSAAAGRSVVRLYHRWSTTLATLYANALWCLSGFTAVALATQASTSMVGWHGCNRSPTCCARIFRTSSCCPTTSWTKPSLGSAGPGHRSRRGPRRSCTTTWRMSTSGRRCWRAGPVRARAHLLRGPQPV